MAETEIKKGQLLILKVPPFYEKEYFYEVTSAGEKLIRASLFHSPTVKKSWSTEDFQMLLDHGIIRFAGENEKPSGGGAEVL